MELTGDILIGAPREKVWSALNDSAVLARCIPGCESMEDTSPTERTARVAVKVGPVRARFNGHIRMEDVRPGRGCVLHFEGSGGPAGMARGHSNVDLADEASGTRLRYTTQASVGGKLGQVGGRMIDAAAKQMADQFFTAFNAEVAGAPVQTAIEATAPTDATAPVSAVASAASDAPADASPALAAAPVARPASDPAAAPAPSAIAAPIATSEKIRVLWFALGALSTGFGMWIASLLFD